MAHTYDELKGKTIDELREIAKGLEHEAVKGYTQLNKEHLLPALCKALGVEYHKHPHHAAVGIDKSKFKARLHALRAEKKKAIEGADRKKLKALRREYHRLNREEISRLMPENRHRCECRKVESCYFWSAVPAMSCESFAHSLL